MIIKGISESLSPDGRPLAPFLHSYLPNEGPQLSKNASNLLEKLSEYTREIPTSGEDPTRVPLVRSP
jgi:hypothetical protein